MPSVLCVVSRPEANTPSIVIGLVRELSAKGVRVAVVVESVEPTPLAPQAADYAAAGGEMVVVKAPGSVTSVRRVDEEPSLDELVWELRDEYDIVLAEGFRHSSFLKLEVHRAADGDLLCHKNELLAIAGDRPEGVDVPSFAIDDFAGMADLIRRRFLVAEPGEDAALFVDGIRVPLALFVRQIVAGAIMGMVRPLKGVENPRSVVVSVRKRGQ